MEVEGEHSIQALQQIIRQAGPYTLQLEADQGVIDRGQLKRLSLLIVVMTYIVGGVAFRAMLDGDNAPHTLMNNFMGGFLVTFSLFKMLNLNGVADAFASYDILARRSRLYAMAYPAMELLLGLSYFAGTLPILTNLIVLVLMAIGSVGVYRALMSDSPIQCACVGTVLNLPMTKVTLVEDLAMGAMAIAMLSFHV